MINDLAKLKQGKTAELGRGSKNTTIGYTYFAIFIL